MASHHYQRLSRIKDELIHRIQGGHYLSGDRFFSNRALAVRYGVSYQSAHRLIGELVAEGMLERRERSGTYILGQCLQPDHCLLLFNERAAASDHFGSRLLESVKTILEEHKIPLQVRFETLQNTANIPASAFPVLWECPHQLSGLLRERRPGLLLGNTPPPGRACGLVESITVDDFSGGAAAAEIIAEKCSSAGNIFVIAGPIDDARSRQRVEGFRSIHPRSRVFFAEGWYLEHGRAISSEVLTENPDAVFCCNDRLAQALHERAGNRQPFIIGFDDAPVASALGLNTISLPWDEMATAVTEIVKKYLAGERRSPRQQFFTPRPVLRSKTNIG